MRNSGFKKPTPEKIAQTLQKKRERAKCRVSIKKPATGKISGNKRTLKPSPRRKKVAKTSYKYKPPNWFNKIKPGYHGSTPAQKRAWKVLSETYRQEDYERFKGCAVCGVWVESWRDLQLGHFHRYSLCNSYFKLERKNLLGICAGCNQHDGGLTSYKFGKRLQELHGDDIFEWIEQTNLSFRGQKMDTEKLVELVAKLRPDLVE